MHFSLMHMAVFMKQLTIEIQLHQSMCHYENYSQMLNILYQRINHILTTTSNFHCLFQQLINLTQNNTTNRGSNMGHHRQYENNVNWHSCRWFCCGWFHCRQREVIVVRRFKSVIDEILRALNTII